MQMYNSFGPNPRANRMFLAEKNLTVPMKDLDLLKAENRQAAYTDRNPGGQVPALELDNGEILTEGPTIVQYLADLKPQAGLVPAVGTLERFRVQEMLGYINSEIHKTYSMLFKPNLPADVRVEREEYLLRRYELLDQKLAGRQYLFGDHFTVADAYLFTVMRWAPAVKVDLSRFTNLQGFLERVGARPGVRAALKAEGD